MNIIVCDENRDYLQYIGSLLRQIQMVGTSIITYYVNPDWLSYDIMAHEAAPDLLLINIDLKKQDGIEIAKSVSSSVPYCRVILLCENNRIDPRCFTVEHCYILPKELLPRFLSTAVEKAVLEWRMQDTGCLNVTSNRTHMRLPVRNVLFLEKQQRKTIITMDSESVETYQSPQTILENVHTEAFLQCHKSFYVNYRHILSFSRGCIVLDNRTEIPVGRSYYTATANRYFAQMKRHSYDLRGSTE